MPITRTPPTRQSKQTYEGQYQLPPARLYLSDLESIVNYLKDSTGRTEVWAGAARIDDVQELRDVSRRELADITIRTEAPEATFRLYYGRAFFDPDGGAIAEGLDEILIRGFERPVHVADLLFSRKHLNSPYLARYRAGRWNKTSPLAIRAQLVAAVAGLTFFA